MSFDQSAKFLLLASLFQPSTLATVIDHSIVKTRPLYQSLVPKRSDSKLLYERKIVYTSSFSLLLNFELQCSE